MRILITGGTGFIGTHLARQLAAAGHNVVLLDLHSPTQSLPEGVVYVRGDVRDRSVVRRAMAEADEVFHLAAAHHDFGIDRGTFFSVNENGTRIVCEVMEDLGVTRICFFSSVAVYGGDGLHDETEPPSPALPYGQSKLAAEKILKDWCNAAHGRTCLIMRPAVVFGPGNFANMYKLIRQIDRGFFYPVGPGSNRKSMAFVSNVIAGTLHVWAAHPGGMEVYNYVDKPDMTSREIVGSVYRSLGKSPPRGFLPLGLALVFAGPFDLIGTMTGKNLPISGQGIRKLAGVTSTFEASAIRASGFEPSVALDDGIARMVEWYRNTPAAAIEHRLPPAEVQFEA